MYHTYILYSTIIDKYYIGCCENMDTRLQQHNSGRNASTKHGIPWVLKKTETHITRADAMQREAFIKKMKSRKFIELVIAGER